MPVCFIRREVGETLQVAQLVLMIVAPRGARPATCMIFQAEGVATIRRRACVARSVRRRRAGKLDEIVAPDSVMSRRTLPACSAQPTWNQIYRTLQHVLNSLYQPLERSEVTNGMYSEAHEACARKCRPQMVEQRLHRRRSSDVNCHEFAVRTTVPLHS
jgi:hypothetical protein